MWIQRCRCGPSDESGKTCKDQEYFTQEAGMRFWPKSWFSWERKKNDLSEEIEAHLRIAVQERVDRGESPIDAHAAAMREIGNSALVADVTRSKWGWQWMEYLAQDVRYALRQLIKSPGYAAALVATLTLGLG